MALPARNIHDETASLIARHRPGHAMAQGFYTSDTVYADDIERIIMQDWHFAGLAGEIPDPGDFMLFELLDESVILSRGADGAIHALANVCRHRGSRVCLDRRGTARRFTCPYHAWVYDLDGSLRSARLMGDDLDRAALGLKKVPMELFHGMIFVSFAARPTSFAAIRADLDPVLAPFALERTKIACRKSYPVAANWKLLVENYNECYHCAPAHPEFRRAHPTHMDAARMQPFNDAMAPRAAALGIATEYIDKVGTLCPEGSVDYTFSRHSLYDGYATGSEDGQPLAPLLGNLAGYDNAASDLYVGLLNPMLIYNDHVVIYRFIPDGKDRSVQEIIWLVREDAEAGKDYHPDRLTWLWDVTTIADKAIIEDNQKGVASRYYDPGPLAEMEAYTARFLATYLDRLARHPQGANE
ncbi:MAG: aromatic ring-hydroxylating dioxygenase subunit alpha [Rhodobacteraceae bacterium]|nr:aromatic ring-hydroxylating dioxygenase subunit alpha [Paracoccaceae bacterium]